MNISIRKQIITVLITLALFLCTATAFGGEGPKNIILLIGDGMGVAQITAGRVVKGSLHLERFRTVGLVATHSADKFVTDSAAASTAYATGEKTTNRSIALSPGGKPFKTLVEYAEERGKTTGIVVTSSVTDATPAAFMAHVDSRDKHGQIAEQIAESGVDVLIGGGWGYFVPKSAKGSLRTDGKDLINGLAKGRKIIRTEKEFKKLDASTTGVAALLEPKQLNRASKRNLTLAKMSKKAIAILSKNEKGFFLMIEGSKIDRGGHHNDKKYIIEEVIDFDGAVGAALDFAGEKGETLVVVTADHETGGMALHKGSLEKREITDVRFTLKGHTAEMVPLFAFGPGAEAFGGIQDNAEVGRKLREAIK